MKVVISFDLDGTLSFGDPPGPIEPGHLNELKKGKKMGLPRNLL